MNTFIRKKRMQIYFRIPRRIYIWYTYDGSRSEKNHAFWSERQWSPNFPRGKINHQIRTVENCPDQSSIKTSLLLSMTSPRSVMQCITFSPPWRAIKIFLQREKLCSLHRETFTSPIVIQTEMRIFYGTCCYEWRISGVLLFLFRFPFFFFFFSFNRSDATSLRGDRKKIGVNISV